MIRHRWLLIVAIAAALVGMHHLAAEHRGHAARFAHAPMTLAAGIGSVLMSPTLTAHFPAGRLAARALPTGSVRFFQLYVLRRGPLLIDQRPVQPTHLRRGIHP